MSSRSAPRSSASSCTSGCPTWSGSGIDAVRARGLWAGIDIAPDKMTGREFTEALLAKGILAKEAHGQTVRLAPPIVATESDIDLLVNAFREVITA